MSTFPRIALARGTNRADLVIGGLLIVLGLAVLVSVRSYPPSMTPGAPGPAAFPSLIAGLLLLVAGGLVRSALVARDWTPPQLDPSAVKRNVATLLLLVGFVLLAEKTDFFVSMILLVSCLMILLGEKASTALVVSVLFAAFLYVLFLRVFGVSFPTRF